MEFTIAQQIEARMKARNISIMDLESKAGLKPHAVRNILTGKSKRPSAVNLQAIAEALECSVKDLLTSPCFLKERTLCSSLEKVLKTKCSKLSNHNLMFETVKVVESLLQQKDITVEQFFLCLKEVYVWSLQNDPSNVDQEFAKWFIGLIGVRGAMEQPTDLRSVRSS